MGRRFKVLLGENEFVAGLLNLGTSTVDAVLADSASCATSAEGVGSGVVALFGLAIILLAGGGDKEAKSIFSARSMRASSSATFA